MLVILSALGAGKIFVRQAHFGRVAQIDELDSHQRLAIHVVRLSSIATCTRALQEESLPEIRPATDTRPASIP